MIYGLTNTKPGAGTPGFAQSTRTMFASIIYCIGLPNANVDISILPFARDGARCGAALLRGGAK